MLSNRAQHLSRLFLYSSLIMMVLGLTAIWLPKFPAMQDYPQHLFMANVISDLDNTDLNWLDFFEVDLKIGPYLLFYLIVSSLASILPIDIAGKLFISLAFSLVTLFILVWNKVRCQTSPPWTLLVMFPLFFSQVYYMGFTNYLISIPILFLALLVHEETIKQSFTLFKAGTYFLLLILLFFSHPYTLLVFIAFSLVISLLSLQEMKGRKYVGFIVPLVIAALFVWWYLNTFNMPVNISTDVLKISWWPQKSLFYYFLLPFMGMRVNDGYNYSFLILWGGIALILFFAALLKRKPFAFRLPFWQLFILSLAGYILLPFWVGDYSYFNLRLAIICYFLLGIVFSNLQLNRLQAYLLTVLLCCVMVLTINKQVELSEEVEELMPIFSKMEKNATIFPIYTNSEPKAIDSNFFYQFHAHGHYYYHIIVGGGAPSTIFPSKMNPIKFKENVSMPSIVAEPEAYKYIIVRGHLSRNYRFLKTHRLIEESKLWQLYSQ
jgi:hypothetical protein